MALIHPYYYWKHNSIFDCLCLFWVHIMMKVCSHSVISERALVFPPPLLSRSQPPIFRSESYHKSWNWWPWTLGSKKSEVKLSSVVSETERDKESHFKEYLCMLLKRSPDRVEEITPQICFTLAENLCLQKTSRKINPVPKFSAIRVRNNIKQNKQQQNTHRMMSTGVDLNKLTSRLYLSNLTRISFTDSSLELWQPERADKNLPSLQQFPSLFNQQINQLLYVIERSSFSKFMCRLWLIIFSPWWRISEVFASQSSRGAELNKSTRWLNFFANSRFWLL